MTVAIGVGYGDAADAVKAVQAAVEQARAQLGGVPAQAAYITSTVDHEATRVHAAFQEALAGVPLHGVTTSLGVLTPDGVRNEGHGAVAVMLVGGAPGTAFVASSLEAEGRRAGEAAARELVRKAGGKMPRMILFNASPGEEEAMLTGIASVCPEVPCQGGSAADHAIAGQWSVFTQEGPVPTGVSLLGIFGEGRVGTALSTPYSPTGERARATGTQGRTLLTLNGQPAAQVLGRWLEGAIDHQVHSGGNILAQTALRPIAVRRDVGSRTHYVTVHPAQVHAELGAVDIFARIEPDDEVCLMTGTAEGLVAEVAHLIDMALAHGNLTTRDVKGATLIFCAGCAGALGPRIDEGLRTFSATAAGRARAGTVYLRRAGPHPGPGQRPPGPVAQPHAVRLTDPTVRPSRAGPGLTTSQALRPCGGSTRIRRVRKSPPRVPHGPSYGCTARCTPNPAGAIRAISPCVHGPLVSRVLPPRAGGAHHERLRVDSPRGARHAPGSDGGGARPPGALGVSDGPHRDEWKPAPDAARAHLRRLLHAP